MFRGALALVAVLFALVSAAPARATCPPSFTVSTIGPDGDCIFRDYSTDGVPSSGPYNPQKSQVRQWGDVIGANAVAPSGAQTISGPWNFTNAAGITVTPAAGVSLPFQLQGKNNFGSGGAIPLFIPTNANQSLTLDISPRGTPTEFGYGATWFDMSNREVSLSLPLAGLHFDTSFANSRSDIDGTEYNSGTNLPVFFGQMNGDTAAHNDTFVINADGTYQELNGVAKQSRTVIASGAVPVAITDHIVFIKKTTGAATAVSLFASPRTGAEITIKDAKGDAATNNITITPAAGNIDAGTTAVINTNYGSWKGVYNGTSWSTM